MSAIAGSVAVKALIEAGADPSVIDGAEERVTAGTHRWAFDPHVDGVVGLLIIGESTSRDGWADLVVYLTKDGKPADFEGGEW